MRRASQAVAAGWLVAAPGRSRLSGKVERPACSGGRAGVAREGRVYRGYHYVDNEPAIMDVECRTAGGNNSSCKWSLGSGTGSRPLKLRSVARMQAASPCPIHFCPSVRASVRPFLPSVRSSVPSVRSYPSVRPSVPSVNNSVHPSVRSFRSVFCPYFSFDSFHRLFTRSFRLFVRSLACLSVRLFVRSSGRSFVRSPSDCSSVLHSVRPTVLPSIHPSVRPFVRPFVRPSVRPSIRLPVCSSVRPSARQHKEANECYPHMLTHTAIETCADYGSNLYSELS